MKIENPIAYSFIMQDELYLLNKDKTLYTIDARPHFTEETQEVPADLVFMGGRKKNFLVIVHYLEQDFIEDKHLTALQSILNRLEFGLDDVAIFNRAKFADIPFEHLVDFFKPQKLLLLGKQALPNGIGPLTLNKPRQINNCNTLFSFSFDEMMDSNENKKAFWEQMKQL